MTTKRALTALGATKAGKVIVVRTVRQDFSTRQKDQRERYAGLPWDVKDTHCYSHH